MKVKLNNTESEMKRTEKEDKCNNFSKRSSYYPYLAYFLPFPNVYLSNTSKSRFQEVKEELNQFKRD